MRAADTNLLVRMVVRDDERQASLADDFVAHGAWVSLVVLAEFAWVLESSYARTRVQIAKAFERLIGHGNLTFQEPETVLRSLELFQTRTSIEFADCLILESARKSGNLPLGTFDRRFGKLDGAALV